MIGGGIVGNEVYWKSAKADKGWNYYKQGKGASSPFSLSETDYLKELGAGNQANDLQAAIDYWKNKNTTVNYISQAPKLPEYKPMTYNWEQAMSEAAPSVNTYYDKTLQDYLKTVETRKTRTAEDLATSMANYDTQGRYLGEDYSTNLANLATNAKLSGQGEAATATANTAGLKGGLASAGLTFSGLGQEKLNQNDVARRLSLAAATASLNQAKGAAETTKTRGMESIGTGKKSAQTAADRAQQDIITEKEREVQDLEYKRAADISDKASQLYSQQQAAWQTANPYWASIIGG
jgi:hypothetical protein